MRSFIGVECAGKGCLMDHFSDMPAFKDIFVWTYSVYVEKWKKARAFDDFPKNVYGNHYSSLIPNDGNLRSLYLKFGFVTWKFITVMHIHIVPVHKQYIKDFSILQAFHNSSMIKDRKIRTIRFVYDKRTRKVIWDGRSNCRGQTKPCECQNGISRTRYDRSDYEECGNGCIWEGSIHLRKTGGHAEFIAYFW